MYVLCMIDGQLYLTMSVSEYKNKNDTHNTPLSRGPSRRVNMYSVTF